MPEENKVFYNALKNVFTEDELKDEKLYYFIDSFQALYHMYSDADFQHPMFKTFFSKLPDLIHEVSFQDFLEEWKNKRKNKDLSPEEEECFREILKNIYKPKERLETRTLAILEIDTIPKPITDTPQ